GANQNGRTPRLEVALYEFGNDGLSGEQNYVRKVVGFTTELDSVSEALFALRTNGGSEFCGAAIDASLKDLEWSKRPGDLNLIFIAGNEPFTQGPISFQKVCGEARQRGIAINTIYCGGPSDPDAAGWAQGAALAEGRYLTLDQNQQVAHIQAPQDQELANLSLKLNESYIPYGASGQQSYARQQAQDANAAGASSEVAAYRASVKSSKQYNNSSWDLVDAAKDEAVDLGSLSDDQLPEEMKGMSAGERKAYVAGKQKEREEVQARIQKLTEERENYVANKRAESGQETLDTVVLGAVREQAQKKGYTFK
ncbi:MAG: hypothetical protein AB1758_31050, partial [Candidatus Eremiobacterota bacterium]